MLILLVMTIWALNLRHLRALAAIARLGSISAAAQAVNLTQPAVTQALAKLEATLGQPLFERRPDGMTANAAARLLAPRIEAACAHVASPRVTMAQMRALIMLADSGSYAGAGAATGLAQPSLHRSIADLSLALRRSLVARRGKGVALTDAGRRTVRAFRLARAELEAGLLELAALGGRETGRITIGAMPLSRARLLPAAVCAFHRAWPDVHIAIVEGSFQELIEPLRDGEIDMMIGALRDPDPGLDVEQRPLFDDRPVVIGRAGHSLVGTVIDAAALARFSWTVPGPGTPLRVQWERMFSDAAVAIPPVPITCGSVITIRQILLESDFLTLLSPDQVAVELEAGWLTQIAETPRGLTRTIGVTTRHGWRPTAMQRAFTTELVTVSAFGSIHENL
ncbi:MAG: transcriptional regulator CysB [Pseudomonadota bacterium]|jgi:DNA-binding transcriptional LysR family regulator